MGGEGRLCPSHEQIMLKIYEKISDGEEVWYEEITEDPKGLPNAYYTVVGEERIPLPFFFPYKEYRGLGGTLVNSTFSHIHKQNDLPLWAHRYVWAWARRS